MEVDRKAGIGLLCREFDFRFYFLSVLNFSRLYGMIKIELQEGSEFYGNLS